MNFKEKIVKKASRHNYRSESCQHLYLVVELDKYKLSTAEQSNPLSSAVWNIHCRK